MTAESGPMIERPEKLERPPTHPGEFIAEDILDELGLSQGELADALGVSRRTVNELVNEKRGVSAEMALRLARFTRTSPALWLNLQTAYDLWQAEQRAGPLIKRIQPYDRDAAE